MRFFSSTISVAVVSTLGLSLLHTSLANPLPATSMIRGRFPRASTLLLVIPISVEHCMTPPIAFSAHGRIMSLRLV
ncbi:hypothetical protein GYMLUDRAFT_678214 [Collybiopsis luxurians FD-317 M1]|uniref:Secreted protein n=1 Tax=Collybiopsis luxurians FD-317 M1 TaxID=944289 RepID=A0A0D0CLD4_9AGAR|nr:hypothetical protein GYMLUDRAFT_678214 [Collybiopsis luxurians FD-317 M1]